MKTAMNVRFNEEQSNSMILGAFAVSLPNKYIIYQSFNFELKNSYTREHNSYISLVTLLNHTNLVAFQLQTLDEKRTAKHCVVLWDDHNQISLLQLEFKTDVLNLILSKDHLIVVLQNHIFAYNLFKLPFELLSQDTRYNPLGLCDYYYQDEQLHIVYPGQDMGSLVIQQVEYLPEILQILPLFDGPLQVVTLSKTKSYVAVCDQKGLKIKIVHLASMREIAQLTRGKTNVNWQKKVKMQYICFGYNDLYLACISSSRTLHVFNISEVILQQEQMFLNQSQFQQFLGWSLVNNQVKIIKRILHVKNLAEKAIIAFNEKNDKICIIDYDGFYREIELNLKKKIILSLKSMQTFIQ